MGEDSRRDEELLRRLEKANVFLIEWEHTLLIRLGVPFSKDGVRPHALRDCFPLRSLRFTYFLYFL